MFKTFLYNSSETDENYIHLACHSNVSYEILPKIIKEFKNTNPNAVFEIENIPFERALEKVINEEIDFAIYPVDSNKRIRQEVEFKDFYEDSMVLVMHKDYWLASKDEKSITKEDIVQTNLVCMDKTLLAEHKYLDFLVNDNNFYNDLFFINSNWETLKAMVKENLCIAGMSEHYINEYDKKHIVIKKVQNMFLPLKYCIIFKKGTNFKEKIHIFLELLKSKYCSK